MEQGWMVERDETGLGGGEGWSWVEWWRGMELGWMVRMDECW